MAPIAITCSKSVVSGSEEAQILRPKSRWSLPCKFWRCRTMLYRLLFGLSQCISALLDQSYDDRGVGHTILRRSD